MNKKSTMIGFTILALALCIQPGTAGARSILPAEVSKMAPEHSFTVNSNADDANASDWIPGDGNCTDSMGRCTLRAAIEETNALAGADSISFANSMLISVDIAVGALPIVTDQLRIDASSVWDTNLDQPGLRLDGGDQSMVGLDLRGNNCEIYGLSFNNFSVALAIYSHENMVGGLTQGQRNVISGSKYTGVSIYGPNAHDNVVQKNWIGLKLSGTAAEPNQTGLKISGGAYGNTIGSLIAGGGNVISGNTHTGIEIMEPNSNGNKIYGNLIGLPAKGNLNVGNGSAGVHVSNGPQNTQIGSGDSEDRNIISNNGNAGVIIWSANNNWVELNTILKNVADGVSVIDSSGNYILYNLIALNQANGVLIDGSTATGNSILANKIYNNVAKGIELFNGGNTELAAPIIMATNTRGAYGTGCAGCTIHIFSDAADEGEIVEGVTTANSSGKWIYTGALTGSKVTATNTDSNHNTSEFSAPKYFRSLYLPIIRK